MAAFSLRFRRCVHVYEIPGPVASRRFARVSTFGAEHSSVEHAPLDLLYVGRCHYEVLLGARSSDLPAPIAGALP